MAGTCHHERTKATLVSRRVSAGTVGASRLRMRRAEQRTTEDSRADLHVEDERNVDYEEEEPVTRRSGVVPRLPEPRFVEPEPLSRAGHVLRSLRVHEALAELAAQHVAFGEEEEALAAIADAFAVLDQISDRRPYTRVLIGIGECLVDLGYPERAEPRLAETVALADALPDRRLGAAARRALGRARLLLGDSSCRKILKDARAMFEGLGDREAALDVDRLSEATAAAIMELPRPRLGRGGRA